MMFGKSEKQKQLTVKCEKIITPGKLAIVSTILR